MDERKRKDLSRYRLERAAEELGFARNIYVKSGVFPPDTSKMIGAAFEVRGNADYEDYYVVTHDSAQEQINNAEAIINMITHYLESRWAELTSQRGSEA